MNGKGMGSGEQQSIINQIQEKTLIKSASKSNKGGLLRGVHHNVYNDKNFMVMNENRGPVMITA